MNKESEATEKFKIAIASTAKAVSGNKKLEIKFGNQQSSEKNSFSLPEIINLRDYTKIRALADSESLKIKYTDMTLNELKRN